MHDKAKLLRAISNADLPIHEDDKVLQAFLPNPSFRIEILSISILPKSNTANMGSIEEPIVELDVLLVGAGFGSFTLMNR